MSRAASLWLAISLMGPLVFTTTQGTSPVPSNRPPQLLFIHRESVKAANMDAYNAIEREAVRTCVRLKCPNTYFAMESGRDIHLVWFLTPVDSQEEVDRVNAIYAQNSELKKAMARIVESKKDIVTPPETGLVKYRAELSHDFGVDFPHAHWFTITVIKVAGGHLAEFEERQKLINRAAGNRESESAVVRPAGLVYQGASEDAAHDFYVIQPRRDLIKKQVLLASRPRDAGPEADVDRLGDAAIANSETISFNLRPDFSYVPREWIAADPKFWAPAGIRDLPRAE